MNTEAKCPYMTLNAENVEASLNGSRPLPHDFDLVVAEHMLSAYFQHRSPLLTLQNLTECKNSPWGWESPLTQLEKPLRSWLNRASVRRKTIAIMFRLIPVKR